MRKLLKMLSERGISEDEAIKYIEKSIPYKRTWKMWRFTMYLWRRVYYDKEGSTKTRIDVVREMVRSGKYERLYATFPLPLPMDKEKEVKNLTQLIAEPRQNREFKSKNFVYEGKPGKNIPQSVIDRLR